MKTIPTNRREISYTINGEEIAVIVKCEDELEEWQDGDWEMRLYFQEYVAITYIDTSSAESALGQMEDKLSHLLSVDQPEEITIELKGIWK